MMIPSKKPLANVPYAFEVTYQASAYIYKNSSKKSKTVHPPTLRSFLFCEFQITTQQLIHDFLLLLGMTYMTTAPRSTHGDDRETYFYYLLKQTFRYVQK
ncbi:hypothetical protein Vretimale_17375 [Volvox reticuliferus]|uniref:Uncharacterized protein n=1 Tax=Volvox reticuliferus TaxID=1737510 RepID=A0A8J4LYA5_9CHLO|nr:hypothetical protein Vretimale_17375 [Volvox reticuliferus]